MSVAGTRLHVNQSEEELNGHRLSLNGLLVIIKCTNVLTVFFSLLLLLLLLLLFLIYIIFHKLKFTTFRI